MRKIIIALAGGALLAAALSPAVHADGPPQHTHNLATPGAGDPTIGLGFCQVAAHHGFHQFHSLVHHSGQGRFGPSRMSSSGKVDIVSTNICVFD